MKKEKVLLIIFFICLPIVLLLLSYKITLAVVDLNSSQQNTFNYLQTKADLTLNYTYSEVSHLQDVRTVMHGATVVFYFLILISTLIITYSRNNKELLHKFFKYGGLAAIVSLSFILFLFVINFNFLFILFHKIFFPQGNWIFPSNSLLIQTFPLSFFIKIGLSIFLQTFLYGIGFLVLAYWLRKKAEKNNIH